MGGPTWIASENGWLVSIPTKSALNRCVPIEMPDENAETWCALPNCIEGPEPSDELYPEEGNATSLNTTIVTVPGTDLLGQDTTYSYDMKCTHPEKPKWWNMTSMTEKQRSEHCTIGVRSSMVDTMYSTSAGSIVQMIAQKMGALNRVVKAIDDSRWEIFTAGILMAYVFSFMYIVFLRLFAKPVIYSMIALIVGCLLGATALCYWRAGYGQSFASSELDEAMARAQNELDNSELQIQAMQAEDKGTYEMAAFAMTAITMIFLVLLIWSRQQIKIVILIVKEAGKTIADMPHLMFFPLLTVLFIFFVALYALGVFAFICTSKASSMKAHMMDIGDKTAEAVEQADLSAQNTKRLLLTYHIFGFLWTYNTAIAIGVTVIAGAVSHWYFHRPVKGEKTQVSRIPVVLALKAAMTKNLGSILFGTLIITIVQMIRLALEYVCNQTKHMDSNPVVKMVKCCLRLAMWCLEKCVKFVTGYAFIYVAMEGQSFCSSCVSTVKLMILNPRQTAMCTAISRIITLLSVTSIPLICSAIGFRIIDDKGVANPMYPTFMILFLSYGVCSCCSSVFQTSIETLYVCSFRDKEKYGGKHLPEQLAKVMGVKQEDKKDEEKVEVKVDDDEAVTA